MEIHFIGWLDYVLLPIYIGVIYLFAYRFRNAHYPPGHPWRPYFIPGLTVKIAGAIFIGMVYQYYYGIGDTYSYFHYGQIINSALSDSFIKWLNLLFRTADWYDGSYSEYISQLRWYTVPSAHTVSSISALVSNLTFDTFLPTSILFATLSFTGIWAMFRTFAIQYPGRLKWIARALLFVPSVFIWGSGIFKDTICMFGLGWLLYGTFQLLVQRSLRIQSLLLAFLGLYLVYLIKVYILVAFFPALVLWVLFTYTSSIRSSFRKGLARLSVLLLVPLTFLMLSSSLNSLLGQYSAENLVKTSTITRNDILVQSGDEGSAYSLGEIDPSLGGMLRKFPAAVNVALYRPYLWEARKPLAFFNAVEAAAFLAVTVWLLITAGPRQVWSVIRKDPNVQFCLLFTLVFAFAIGISTYNFGTLSRYRIPCLPLFALALAVIYEGTRSQIRHALLPQNANTAVAS